MQDRGVKGEVELESVFAHPLMLARRVREQRLHQRGKKIYSLHAPEVECIGNRRQGPSPLRVWHQGLARHHAPSLQGRPVHCPRQGAARQPLQRPHAGDRESGRSAQALPASSPTAAIAATTLRPTTGSRSTSRARDAASPRPSNANSAAARRSSRSSDTPRPGITCAETTSPGRRRRERDPRRRRGRSDPLARLPLRFIETRCRAN
jgi:hypothetical protein